MRRIITALALVAGTVSLAWAVNVAAVRALVDQGDAKDQSALGTMYRDGQGVARNYTEALKWRPKHGS